MHLLRKEKRLPGQQFAVFTYVLSTDIGSNGLRGLLYVHSVYSNYSDAKKIAKKLTKEMDPITFQARVMCDWHPITDKFDPKEVKYINDKQLDDDMKGIHKKHDRQLKDEYERQKRLGEEIERDQDLEDDPTTIEYYTRKWYLLIKKQEKIDELQKMLDDLKSKKDDDFKEINELKTKYPEYETKWLDVLHDKLIRRNEQGLYEYIKNGYEKNKQ